MLQLRSIDRTNQVLNVATLDGAMGEGANVIDRAALTLIASGGNSSEFPLGGESRLDKFVNTIATFGKGGACLGALVGDAAMLIPDVIIGRGDKLTEDSDTKEYIKSMGGMGAVAWGSTALSSTVAEIAAMGVGGAVAAVDSPVMLGTGDNAESWFSKHMNGFGNAAATGVAAVVGMATGAAATAARAVSLAVKYTVSGVMALGSLIVGFLAGSFRAIFNV